MKKNLFALMGVLCGIVSAVICVYSIQSGSSDIRLMYGAMAAFILCGTFLQLNHLYAEPMRSAQEGGRVKMHKAKLVKAA